MEETVGELEKALNDHDRLIADSGIEIWLGAEPTFTDRTKFDAEWKSNALGEEKERRARLFVRRLAAACPESVVMRTLGRQYPGEDKPRWSLGVYASRDGVSIWDGPPDPLTNAVSSGSSSESPPTPSHTGFTTSRGDDSQTVRASDMQRLLEALASELQQAGKHVTTDLPARDGCIRLLFADDAQLLSENWHDEALVTRPPVQSQAIPTTGVQDELASRGVFLVAIGICHSGFAEDIGRIQLELPAFAGVAQCREFLGVLGRAARAAELHELVLAGFPPPVDQTVAWTTVTPDPGVIEINMAPCHSVSEFLVVQRNLHTAAESIGLSAFQLLFNGEAVDSGGGQHLTFGGPTAESSPFVQRPHLLPRLIAYLNRHPALSYWFAVRSVGSCGQQPRPDEVSPESLDGLSVALDQLYQQTSITPESLWRSVAPFLCDRFGNTHRCEINVEKFWNSLSAERGCLGLVELRAFRMTRSPEDAAAVACFIRTLIAALALRDDSLELIHWGERLHDHFSLPFYLLRDLREVMTELSSSGFLLHDSIASRLVDDSLLVIGVGDLDGARLTVRQAIEFWPVVGDLSSQNESSRIMDSSTSRIEIMLEVDGSEVEAEEWCLSVLGYEVPWVVERESGKTVLLRGVRYKVFNPQIPVSPLVSVVDPLEFEIRAPGGKNQWRCRLHNWRPDGAAYDGLPIDMDEARCRRNERLVIEQVPFNGSTEPLPLRALSEYCVDLRRMT